MTEDTPKEPSAEMVSVEFATGGGKVPIAIDSEALLVDDYYQPRVSLRIGTGPCYVRLVLTSKAARMLRDDLDDAVSNARAAVQERLDQDDIKRDDDTSS